MAVHAVIASNHGAAPHALLSYVKFSNTFLIPNKMNEFSPFHINGVNRLRHDEDIITVCNQQNVAYHSNSRK